MKVLVKGSIDKVAATAFDRGMFNAGLFAQGILVGEGPVDENGSYAFTVEAAAAASTDNNENAGSVDTSTGSEIGEEAWILLAACLTGIGALVLKKRYQA